MWENLLFCIYIQKTRIVKDSCFGVCMVCLGRVELPHPAPEAGALSTELQAHCHANDIVA